ncbi:SAM-dependent methyltransferase [Bacteroides sp. OttesenSCG-928-D19]|nr:SAM-dependent methyltransferase [Bacteroides sp. OttesenSCG-928-D19]
MQLSPETLKFISAHEADDVRTLALKAARHPGVDVKAAIAQIAGRQMAAVKIPSWHARSEVLYPAHLSLEQCSSETTARYKAGLVGGETLTDLTGGFGVDCAFMATSFASATYVERQAELCELVAHNFSVMALNHIDVVNADAIDHLNMMDKVDCIYLDPARRDRHGRKTVQLSDCEPDVSALESLLLAKADCVLVKLSPMLDISLAQSALAHVAQVHIIAVANECKELLFVLKKEVDDPIGIQCVNFANTGRQTFAFARPDEQSAPCPMATQPEQFLYEPNAAILKAGAYRSVAARFGLKKLHPNSHLYTSDAVVAHFPGRIFQVEGFGPLKDRALLAGVASANISVRNFPLTVADLRKRLRLTDGGDVYLFGTTLADGKKVLIRCHKH